MELKLLGTWWKEGEGFFLLGRAGFKYHGIVCTPKRQSHSLLNTKVGVEIVPRPGLLGPQKGIVGYPGEGNGGGVLLGSAGLK